MAENVINNKRGNWMCIFIIGPNNGNGHLNQRNGQSINLVH